MATREELHEEVDALPDPQVAKARIVVEEPEDPMIAAFRDAPEDDEPWTDEDEAATKEADEDITAGRMFSLEEIKRELDDAYRGAWDEWAESGEGDLWETATGDGL